LLGSSVWPQHVLNLLPYRPGWYLAPGALCRQICDSGSQYKISPPSKKLYERAG
jgi:hypothetical protein